MPERPWRRPRNLQELMDRTEAPLRLYESLVPYGIDRFMPLILQEFERRQNMKDGIERRTRLWDIRVVRYAAIAGVVVAIAEMSTLILAVWNALTIHGVIKP